jgi:hypothetical protein
VRNRGARNSTFASTRAGFTRFVDAVTPWLLDLGNWIFGGLIAFSLVMLGALLTVGPVDDPVKISTAAFAVALPLDIAGFVLLRLAADVSKVGLGGLGTKAFQEVGFSVEDAAAPEATEQKLRNVALIYSYVLLAVTALLTLVGVAAALWHMAWWIGVSFVVMVFVSQVVILAALSALDPGGRWRTPGGEIEPPKPPRSRP